MKNTYLTLIPVAVAGVALAACRESPSQPSDRAAESRVERGEYLVRSMACYDCHTPWVMGPEGPEPDESRWLSGHPADVVMTEAPALPSSPWSALVSETMTAWAGPWGVSFTANLTPHDETGLGLWTEEEFIATMHSGRRRGLGRPILPPMPYHAYRNLSDYDLGAIFAYLQSLPPIDNRIPEPLPPPVGS